MYSLCVTDGVCKQPIKSNSITHPVYYGNNQFDNYPVIYVDWNMAETYCEWRDARLPTEAEWEKAARGMDGKLYPWGNDAPTGNLLNYDEGDTTEVGRYPNGASPYGALDMAGNVLEWIADHYGEKYYVDSPELNPLGPDSGSYRVIRGGTWLLYYCRGSGTTNGQYCSPNGGGNFTTTFRFGYPPNFTNFNLGFRCAKDVAP